MKLKELKKGEKFPTDFWNYNINPIVGFNVPTRQTNNNKDKLKYGIIPINKDGS
jgi:hypothetical protein